MSFNVNGWGVWGPTGNVDSGNTYLYKSSADALATITASAYFNDKIEQLELQDLIYVQASDGIAMAVVTSVTTNVTVEVITAQAGTHYVVFGGTHTTVGGGATEDITVTGALATDIAIVTLKTEGAAPVTLDAATAKADAIGLTFSADPSTDHVVSYVVFRAY